MQPTHIPWIGFFDMIDKVDVFVFYDDVQLTKRSWQVRNRLRNKAGEFWLSVPVMKTSSRDDLLIKDAKLNNQEKWKKKHLATIQTSYSKAPYYKDFFSLIEPIYENAESLVDLNIGIISMICEKLGITTKLVNSSELQNIEGNKDHRLVCVCKELGMDSYLSAQGSALYINEKNQGGEFVIQDINLYYHAYEHPEYKQVNNEFIPYLGIFDLIFNEGFEKGIEIIRSGRQTNLNYDEI